jgi:glycosyltransferase involved in cell wall biosynthesis
MARVLGADLYEVNPGRRSFPAPVRYPIQAARTLARVIGRRPRNVIVSNPPFVAALWLDLFARPLGYRVWVDAHSGAFNDPRWSRFSALNDWVLRHSRGVILATDRLAGPLRERGVEVVIVNYPGVETKSRRRNADGGLVATLGYQFDEPVRELLEAAARAPRVSLVLTGNAPAELRALAPPNCTFTGWLDRREYDEVLAGARGVVCLTTREETMQTGAYEALQFALPMMLSGTAALRDIFDRGVVFVDEHDPSSLAAGLEELWKEHERLGEEAEQGRAAILERFRQEMEELRTGLAGGAP